MLTDVTSGDAGENLVLPGFGWIGAGGMLKGSMERSFQFRAAMAADIETLVDLMMVSSWGGIRHAWERVRSPRETWRQRGAAEIADVGCEIGYSRFVVAEERGRVAGMILLNCLGDTSALDPALEPPNRRACSI